MNRLTNFASRTRATKAQTANVAALVVQIPDATDQVDELAAVTGMPRATVTEALWHAEQAGTIRRVGPGRWAAA